MMHITSFYYNIYRFEKALIFFMKVKEVITLIKYLDFANVFFSNSIIKPLEHIDITNYSIN